MTPGRLDFTRKERSIIDSHRTPRQVQRFLTRTPYNRETRGATCLSFRGVVRDNRAHCLEGAVSAAVILEQHGYPPLVVSIESQDKLDHVLFLFRHNGLFGAVARSRDVGLHGRKPVFRRVRDLVMSYFDTYVDNTGRITAYAVADLRDLGGYDWRLSERNVWKVERYLQDFPHRDIQSSDERYRRLLRRYRDFRRQYPDRPADFYPTRHLWML
jgi:hypothetical protein